MRAAGPTAERQVEAAMRKTGADIAADAQSFAPVDTGALKNSIGMDVEELAGGGLSVEVGPTLDYAIYVERGTARQAPQPFMGPAADRRFPQLIRAVESVGGSVLDV